MRDTQPYAMKRNFCSIYILRTCDLTIQFCAEFTFNISKKRYTESGIPSRALLSVSYQRLHGL